ncbi:MAG: glycosyltransferase family 2 protein [Candidatus Eisenbacteria bacterium]|uniref:Glycosyltransferase family 2 protein n=1 Tax=Eiseniibacteriota bacterium TaxID=2212470 RepID=A0A9D6LAL9_UNCEI|nr:glycosyltransferase family 2 protein [Candidatus Eisenbacteria bacterium]MBI3539114.1 glycosyltransferase family 2 protein [Candidatus Eisenbacteria bacterium]
MHVAALLPAYQAEAHLGPVLARLARVHPAADTLVVDDGSQDATRAIAERAGVRVHAFAANRGKGRALLEGFRLLGDYDGVVTLDADGQHPPECLPEFVRAAEAGADIALGVRARVGTMPAIRRLANGAASGWASWLAGQTVGDSQCGYRLYRRRVLERTPITPGRYEVETEIVVRAARLGFRVVTVPIPTVYADETSHIRTMHDVPRIFGVLARLTLEGAMPPAAMRRAARTAATP